MYIPPIRVKKLDELDYIVAVKSGFSAAILLARVGLMTVAEEFWIGMSLQDFVSKFDCENAYLHYFAVDSHRNRMLIILVIHSIHLVVYLKKLLHFLSEGALAAVVRL